MDPSLNHLLASFPGRKTQIEQLYNLFGYEDEPFVDSLYIHGGPSSGKSSVINAVLKTLKIKHAAVNLIECYTSKILLESILNKLTDHKLSGGQPIAKCDNMMDFIENLKRCADEHGLNRSVIVLDKAEQLRRMDFNLMPCFAKMRELSGLNVCVVFLSEIVFQKYYTRGNVAESIKISFRQYNKDEIMNILSLDYEHCREMIDNNFSDKLDMDIDFFKNYLNVFLSVFYRACRDLSELRYMARINFVKYCQPVFKKECGLSDSMALWRHIAPILKSNLEVLYLRLSTSSQDRGRQIDANKQFTFSRENLAQSLELPFYAKYLLIAAYLASYNPAKDDKRIFMKFHKKKRKTMKDVKIKSKMSERLSTQLGPKPFSFDRLLAIFYAILDDKVGFNNNLLVQVSSLVELQLLTALSDNCNLDGQKYKCAVGYEFIQTISKMVGFNIRKYLSDFSHI